MSTLPSSPDSLRAQQPAEPARTPLHAPSPHESGLKHTSGEARYVEPILQAALQGLKPAVG